MISSTINTKTRTYIFELQNCAGEFGFKTNSWKLDFATDLEKKNIEKEFHPTLSMQVSSANSVAVFDMVSSALTYPDLSAAHQPVPIQAVDDFFLVAFHPDRKR